MMPNFCFSECAGCVSVSIRSHWRRIAERFRLPVKEDKEMHRQTLRMSLALARNVRAVFRRPLHARDAEQRSGRRRTAPDPIQ